MGNMRSKPLGREGSSSLRTRSASLRGRSGRESSHQPQTKLVATDVVDEGDAQVNAVVPGLIMEKGGYNDVIKRMETGRKEEWDQLKKKEEEERKRREDERKRKEEAEEADRLMKEKNKLTQMMIGRFEADKHVKVKKEKIDIDNDSERISQVIEALEAAALEKSSNGDRQVVKKGPSAFSQERGELVQKRMRSYKRLDKAAKIDPTKGVDESEERWQRESSLQKSAKVPKTEKELYSQGKQERELKRMAEELKAHFDLDAVLAAAGMKLETLIAEQPENFLKLYYRSRDAFGGPTALKKTPASSTQVHNAARTSMAHLSGIPIDVQAMRPRN